MNPARIEALAKTPRPLDDTVKKIAPRPFFFLRGAIKRWEENMANAPLVFCAVVQANEVLFSAEDATWAPAVLLYTKDPTRCRDGEWLKEVAGQIRQLTEHPTGDAELDKIGAMLTDEDSSFHDHELPRKLTGGVPAFLTVHYVDPDDLPGGFIPEHRLLPALAVSDGIDVIPAELYT